MDTSLLNESLPRLLLGLVIGLVLGSFTTMLAYRLPRGLSIVKPPSRCPSCQARLGVRDLFPVFSFLWNKGRCRHCGQSIGPRYLVIELVTAICTAAAFVLVGLTPILLLWLAGIVALITALTIRIERP
ncbi:MAG: prepilin peptidase [Alphaproteobacteria bacterium]|nr:prepilin peptidase [Alphaproteobacteria bacterium]